MYAYFFFLVRTDVSLCFKVSILNQEPINENIVLLYGRIYKCISFLLYAFIPLPMSSYCLLLLVYALCLTNVKFLFDPLL